MDLTYWTFNKTTSQKLEFLLNLFILDFIFSVFFGLVLAFFLFFGFFVFTFTLAFTFLFLFFLFFLLFFRLGILIEKFKVIFVLLDDFLYDLFLFLLFLYLFHRFRLDRLTLWYWWFVLIWGLYFWEIRCQITSFVHWSWDLKILKLLAVVLLRLMYFWGYTLNLKRWFFIKSFIFLKDRFWMFCLLLIEILFFFKIVYLFNYYFLRFGLIELLKIILRTRGFKPYLLTLQNCSNVFRINFLEKWNMFGVFKNLFYYCFGLTWSFKGHKVFFKFVFRQVIIL